MRLGAVGILLVMAPPPHVASRRILVRRLARNGTLVFVLVFVAVGIGAAGYHFFDDLPWLDAALNATMILTGMGPVNPVVTPAGKLFAIAYALFSGVFFLTMVAVLLAPALQHFLHRFHLELGEQQSSSATRGQAQGGPVRQAQAGTRGVPRSPDARSSFSSRVQRGGLAITADDRGPEASSHEPASSGGAWCPAGSTRATVAVPSRCP